MLRKLYGEHPDFLTGRIHFRLGRVHTEAERLAAERDCIVLRDQDGRPIIIPGYEGFTEEFVRTTDLEVEKEVLLK